MPSRCLPPALIVAAEPLLPARALRERDRIQHGGALVAQDCEGAADRARRLVVAVAAWRVEIDAGAGHQRDRPFHRADDLAERDLRRPERHRQDERGEDDRQRRLRR